MLRCKIYIVYTNKMRTFVFVYIVYYIGCIYLYNIQCTEKYTQHYT